MAVQRGRSERRGGKSYSVSYVEPLSDARTKLEDFFSILLNVNHVTATTDDTSVASLLRTDSPANI